MGSEGGKTLVIGLGNPILGDDGVGWQIAKAAQESYQGDATFELSSSGGLGLMELMVGYERVILADAIVTPDVHIGAVHSQPLDKINATAHSNSSHDASLQAALETGRRMGLQLPDEIWVVAVEIEPSYVFSETLSPAVAAAVPVAADLVKDKLEFFLAIPN
ncbi:MAG: hydrogenase maturation protease [Anaerolineales bacterium]